MKLDKIIVLLFFPCGKRDFLIFNSQAECKKFFSKGSNLEKYQDLERYEIFYSRFAGKG